MELDKKEVVEKKIYEEGKKEYASKGTGNAGLALGIIGTALGAGALWGRSGGLFGRNGMPENVNINAYGGSTGGNNVAPTAFQAWEKSCEDAVELTNTIWRLQMNENTQLNAMRERDVAEKFSLYKGMTEGMFGLYKSQVDADFGLYKNQRDLYDALNDKYGAKFAELDKKVAVMEAIRPYQDRLLQDEIRNAYNSSVNYTDKKTCRCIYGEVVLPNTPVVTGYEGANPFGCNCRQATQQTA